MQALLCCGLGLLSCLATVPACAKPLLQAGLPGFLATEVRQLLVPGNQQGPSPGGSGGGLRAGGELRHRALVFVSNCCGHKELAGAVEAAGLPQLALATLRAALLEGPVRASPRKGAGLETTLVVPAAALLGNFLKALPQLRKQQEQEGSGDGGHASMNPAEAREVAVACLLAVLASVGGPEATAGGLAPASPVRPGAAGEHSGAGMGAASPGLLRPRVSLVHGPGSSKPGSSRRGSARDRWSLGTLQAVRSLCGLLTYAAQAPGQQGSIPAAAAGAPPGMFTTHPPSAVFSALALFLQQLLPPVCAGLCPGGSVPEGAQAACQAAAAALAAMASNAMVPLTREMCDPALPLIPMTLGSQASPCKQEVMALLLAMCRAPGPACGVVRDSEATRVLLANYWSAKEAGDEEAAGELRALFSLLKPHDRWVQSSFGFVRIPSACAGHAEVGHGATAPQVPAETTPCSE